MLNMLIELSEEDERDSGYLFSLKIRPTISKTTLINFVKIDFDDQTKQQSYEQILRYNDYENLVKLFHKENNSTIQEEINLDQSIVLFDFIFTIFGFDKESRLN